MYKTNRDAAKKLSPNNGRTKRSPQFTGLTKVTVGVVCASCKPFLVKNDTVAVLNTSDVKRLFLMAQCSHTKKF